MSSNLSAEKRQQIIDKKRSGGQERILEILLDMQFASEGGYIDKETADIVAKELGLSKTRVYEIVSYYAMLRDKPHAKYVLGVCNSSPCHFSKSEEIAAKLEKILGVKPAVPTADGMFMYYYIPCVGACNRGPVIKLRDNVFGNLTDEKIETLIKGLKEGIIEV